MRNDNDSKRTFKSHAPNHHSADDSIIHSGTSNMTPLSDHDNQAFGMIGDAGLLGLDKITPPAPPNRKQWASVGIFVLMSIAMIATGLVVTAASEKKASTLAAEQARLEESVKGKSQVLRTWIDSRFLASRRLTESRLVRLFVSDMALNPVGSPLPRSLLDQRPYFQTLMADFAQQNDLVRASVIDDKGRILLSSPGPILNITDILMSVSGKLDGWKHIISPIRTIDDNGENLVVDILVPLPKVQTADDTTNNKTTILALTFPVNDILTSILTVPSPRAAAETLSLIQEKDGVPEQISLTKQGFDAVVISQHDWLLPGQKLNFGLRSFNDVQSHYFLGEPVPGVRWTIVHAITSKAALAPVSHFVIVATAIALVAALASSFFFAMLWWRRASGHYHDLISLYRSLAERLDRQRQFLGAVTSSISDWLAVSGKDERYIYASPSFTAALGLLENEVLGRCQHDVLPLKTFVPAEDSFDGLVVGEQVSIADIGDRHHVIAVSSSDLRNQHGQSIGTVTVMRDQTELVEQRQRRVQALTETIDAFVHTIERRDPFLLGHTRLLRSYAIAVGRKLALGDNELTGLALAASLSQIGKIFIPDEILVKPVRHDQREAEVMRGHIDHAICILGRIDFGFPVVSILGQMHERLDGSGYPNGLVDADIDLPGRILGATDVFCARTSPRSYRDRLSAGNALYYLANNASRYDIKVIAALAEVVAKEGELDPTNDLDASFLDTRIWKNMHRLDDSKMDAVA